MTNKNAQAIKDKVDKLVLETLRLDRMLLNEQCIESIAQEPEIAALKNDIYDIMALSNNTEEWVDDIPGPDDDVPFSDDVPFPKAEKGKWETPEKECYKQIAQRIEWLADNFDAEHANEEYIGSTCQKHRDFLNEALDFFCKLAYPDGKNETANATLTPQELEELKNSGELAALFYTAEKVGAMEKELAERKAAYSAGEKELAGLKAKGDTMTEQEREAAFSLETSLGYDAENGSRLEKEIKYARAHIVKV